MLHHAAHLLLVVDSELRGHVHVQFVAQLLSHAVALTASRQRVRARVFVDQRLSDLGAIQITAQHHAMIGAQVAVEFDIMANRQKAPSVALFERARQL